MTKKEAAIVSAYTGILIGSFSDVQEYVEKIIGHPVWVHEFADKEKVKQIKNKSKQDFCNINITDNIIE